MFTVNLGRRIRDESSLSTLEGEEMSVLCRSRDECSLSTLEEGVEMSVHCQPWKKE